MNLLFDFDHTLGIDNRLEERVMMELAKKHCQTIPEKEHILEAIGRFRAGEENLGNVIEDAFSGWNCSRSDRRSFFEEFEERSLALVKAHVRPLPGAVETLSKLHDAFVPMAILSNGWTKLQHAKAKAIGFPGPVIASEEIGAWKPDQRAFLLALDQLKFRIDETVYIGDSPEVDIVGAKHAGLRAVWVNLEGKIYPPDLIAPDWTVTSLRSLLELPFDQVEH